MATSATPLMVWGDIAQVIATVVVGFGAIYVGHSLVSRHEYLQRHKQDLTPIYDGWLADLKTLERVFHGGSGFSESVSLSELEERLERTRLLPDSMAWQHARGLKHFKVKALRAALEDARNFLAVQAKLADSLCWFAESHPEIATNALTTDPYRMSGIILGRFQAGVEYEQMIRTSVVGTRRIGDYDALLPGISEMDLRDFMRLLENAKMGLVTQLGHAPPPGKGPLSTLATSARHWTSALEKMSQEVLRLRHFVIGRDHCDVCGQHRGHWFTVQRRQET